MDTLKVLKDARALIADEAHWLRGRLWNDERTAFCIYGALMTAAGMPSWMANEGMFSAARELQHDLMPSRDLCTFNNMNPAGHAGVRDLFDRTIARLEAQARQSQVDAIKAAARAPAPAPTPAPTELAPVD